MAFISHELFLRFNIESQPLTMATSFFIGLVSTLFCIILNLIAVHLLGPETFLDTAARLHWTREKPGYWCHVMSSIFEWLSIHMFSLLSLCLSRRMRTFSDWDKVHF